MKRGESGLSLLVGVNKPEGLSSHDVVYRCRGIFGEKRCGHTGTLDPLATGVLPICVGPATRLDQYMVGHDKHYRVHIAFGAETTTDDAAGEITERSSIPSFIRDEEFARDHVANIVGVHMQTPPIYSAIKIKGKRAYQSARQGQDVQLEPRRIEVYSAQLVEVVDDHADGASWVVDFHVSKGTYIRSLARDIGRNLTCPAHVAALMRLRAGRISLEHTVSLQTLESLGTQAAIDPIRALGVRFGFADDYERFVNSGTYLKPEQLKLYEPLPMPGNERTCACTSGIVESMDTPTDGELVGVIIANRVKALYRYDQQSGSWKPDCVFSTPIFRGL